MQCEICKKTEATIHLTEIIDGARTEMHLCENCAVNQGVSAKSQLPINELLSGLLASQPEENQSQNSCDAQTVCPECGFTLDQFRKEAVLGCPQDYEVFEKSLMPMVEKVQNGKTCHNGKIPSNLPESSKDQMKLASLKQQLNDAVKKENYEQAAKFRDQIAELES